MSSLGPRQLLNAWDIQSEKKNQPNKNTQTDSKVASQFGKKKVEGL